jgi:hypothetical protein
VDRDEYPSGDGKPLRDPGVFPGKCEIQAAKCPGEAGFLGWVSVKPLQAATAPRVWSLAGVVAAGLLLVLVARFVLRPSFFQAGRESGEPRAETGTLAG